MKIAAVIIARGGSKGIPNKNLRMLGGKPLVAHMITKARIASETIPMDIIFSTDSEDIRNIAIEYGAWAPFLRPAELARDDTPSWPVVKHAVEYAESHNKYQYDMIVYLQPTAPLCRPRDICQCAQVLIENSNFNSAVATVESEIHPFRMKRLLDDGQLINLIDQGFEDMRPRQQLPTVYRRAGSIYASRREIVMEKTSLVGKPCYGVVVPAETAVDIDTPVDLKLVEFLYTQQNHDIDSILDSV